MLRDRIVPELVQRRGDDPIRVWSAGCSSGQEAYSALMLFADVLGTDGLKDRVKVYATDIDEEALEQARQATYSGRELESLPEAMAGRYFEETSRGLTVQADLRRAVIFGRHDLLQDAPISRVDLLLCRNTLMYFNADVQASLVRRLHFSLADQGVLTLGKVEMLLAQADLFEPIDTKHRLFRKLTPVTMRSRLLAMGEDVVAERSDDEETIGIAFELGVHPEIVLDPNRIVVAINAAARTLFGLPSEVVGRPFQDLEVSYRPVELRSSIDRATDEGRPIRLSEVMRWTSTGEITFLDITIAPLIADAKHRGVAISFVDVSRHRQLQEELEQTHRELEVANEELQSSNEELETTNEELQSTNEELETMNEELSSTNEELHAINDELRERTNDLDQVNAYLESILTSLDASVIVVDPELRVRIWNGRSFEMWGLRSDEVEGRALLALDIGFPVEALRATLVAALAGDQPERIEVEATARRGNRIRCLARVRALHGVSGMIQGAIVIIEQLPDGADGDGAEGDADPTD